MSFILALLISLNSLNLNAMVFETNATTVVQHYATKDSLVFFNITGTLYDPALTMANSRWRAYFSERDHSIF